MSKICLRRKVHYSCTVLYSVVELDILIVFFRDASITVINCANSLSVNFILKLQLLVKSEACFVEIFLCKKPSKLFFTPANPINGIS